MSSVEGGLQEQGHRQAAAAPLQALVATPPGLLAEWTTHLLETIVLLFGLESPVRASAEEMAARRTDPGRVFTCAPDAAFFRLAEHIPAIYLAGDPGKDIAFQQTVYNATFSNALRYVSSALVAMYEFRPRNLLFIDSTKTIAHEAIAKILGRLGLSPSNEQWAQLLNSFTGSAVRGTLDEAVSEYAYEPQRQASRAGVRDLREAEIVRCTVDPLLESLRKGERQEVTWLRDLFTFGDAPEAPVPESIDFAGACRVLLYGPYLYLPSGRWELQTTLAFGDESDGTILSIEATQGLTSLARARVRPTRRGTFYAKFPVSILSNGDAVEVRISTDSGSIFGRLSMLGATFTPLEDGEASPA